MLSHRDVVWIGLLALSWIVVWHVRMSENDSAIAELRQSNAALSAELRLAQQATRDCVRDLAAAQKGEAKVMIAPQAPAPAPPPGRGGKGPSLPPRNAEQVLGPRKWPNTRQIQWPDGVIRYSVTGDRCALPFAYNGKTYNDCATLALADAAGGGDASTDEVAQWCPISGVDGVTVEATTSQLRRCQVNFNRPALVYNMIHGIWARIGRSRIVDGVGVIAVRDIPRGQDPFPLPDGQSCGIGEYARVSPDEVKDAPPGVKEMMFDFFAIEPDGRQLMPVQGFNALTTSYYLNHADSSKSNKANIIPRQCNCPVMCFYASKDIKQGEELLFDYVRAFGKDALEQGTFDKISGRRRLAEIVGGDTNATALSAE